MQNYWQTEVPEEIQTERAMIQWYPVAKYLCITQKEYTRWDGSLMSATHRNINISTLASGVQSQEERDHGAEIFSAVAAVFRGEGVIN
jgi:hypothetical protein